MLSHAAKEMGYGWGFGVHEALDQFGAMFGPLLVALILTLSQHDYKLAFAALAVPAVITLSLVLVARRFFPRPQDLSAGPAEVATSGLPRVFWIYLAGAALVAAGPRGLPADRLPLPAGPHGVRADRAGVLRGGDGGQRHRVADLRPAVRQGRDRRADPADPVAGAAYAPLVFLGGVWAAVVGVALWGLGMGVQESIIPAAVAPMVSADRRASAYGLFTGVYGTAWVLGSVVIGVAVRRLAGRGDRVRSGGAASGTTADPSGPPPDHGRRPRPSGLRHRRPYAPAACWARGRRAGRHGWAERIPAAPP